MPTVEASPALQLKNILLATDFSPGSEVALSYASAIARRHCSSVHTIHVAGPNCYQLLQPDAFSITFNGWAGAARDPIGTLRELMQGLPSEVPLHSGQVWEVVDEIVRRNEIDLLVLSSHGRQGIPRLVFGSVAEDVFRNVDCPVLTVGPDVEPCASGELAIKNVLLATHFDPGSGAPDYAKWLCREFDARLNVVHVVEEALRGQAKTAEITAQMNAALGDVADLQFRMEQTIAYGQPSAEILEIARLKQPDLIVLGARHPEPARINSHLPWATAARVIQEAPCPVLTVRER